MTRLNFKLFLVLFFSIFLCTNNIFPQKQICGCERVDNYRNWDYKRNWEARISDINDYIASIERNSWVQEDAGFYENLTIKKSFNTDFS